MRIPHTPKRLPFARIRVAALLAVGASLAAGAVPVGAPAAAADPERPNLVFILTDDQRWDTLALMDETSSRFPIEVPNAFVTTPTCCPSRASYLTGRYARNTGVHTNGDYPIFQEMEPDSLGPWLKDAGYRTGFIGKYLNRFPTSAGTPPGWDEFHALVWDEDLKFIGNGFDRFALRQHWSDGVTQHDEVREYGFDGEAVYSTRLFTELATTFIQRAEDPILNADGAPWALFVWPNAPHPPLIPEPRYAGMPVAEWVRPPSFLEPNMRDKPSEVRRSPFRTSNPDGHLATRVAQILMLESVDDMVQEIFGATDVLGVTDETWGVYTSDNGRFWGEHRLKEKFYAYEESIRVPFRMRAPGVGARSIPDLVANVDVAPTLMDLAEGEGSHAFDGASLVPLVNGSASSWRTAVLIENWQKARYRAIRGPRWKYVRWLRTGHQELYDLLNDPFELRNLAKRKKGMVQRMREQLRALTLAS